VPPIASGPMAAYQSLYRRYRPQRFDEVLGQEHVTKALRNAVREGRVGHAYLFSGPRGTGKTSTARILAKVLNCAAPVDGEPCGKCENCVAVSEGRVIDWLLEQDAASKSKVDDMRDLIERVPLGTSGKRRVIILDEVHMLSQGAENALLKTLEEPPEHVVFVLATTDPQKVRPTIRSRTQHFEFRLLSPDVLADHVRHVIADAGLDLDAEAVDRAVDHVIRSGAGSARDTLSALDQVAALGEVVDASEPVDAVLDALCDHDAGAVLVAVADALAAGRDPRTLGEDLIAALRDAFLAVVGAADEHVAPAQRERAARVGQRLGPAGLTRALDVLGESLIELARKPDPRIVVEVALVRLTQPASDRTLDAILERLDRLERGDGPGGGGGPSRGGSDAASPSGGAAAAREALSDRRSGDADRSPEPQPPTADKPTLGAVVRQQEERGRPAEPAPTVAVAGGRIPDLDEITNAWTGAVLTALPKSVRSRWRGGRWIESDPRTVRFAVSNEWHQKACDESRREVEEALLAHFGDPVPVAIVVEGEPAGAASTASSAPPPDDLEHIDPAELRDADDAVTGVDLVVRTFGGGELIQED
jgi:DNA polymerase III subunit gamma/tau